MANLSNINNKFLFTDGDFLKIGNLAPINNISSTESGISVTNSNVASLSLRPTTAATGKTYALMSEGPGGFRIRDIDANNDRLIINTSGNATFAGSLIANNYISIKTVSSSGSPYIDFLQNTTQKAYIQFNDGANALNFQSDNAFTFIGGSVERVRIDGIGNVGIGTTSPTAPLHIEGGTNSEVLKIEADSAPFIRWVKNGTNVGFLQFLGGSAYLSNMSNGAFLFRTNNTDKMVITSIGDVGIGTTSPQALLDVSKNNSVIYDPTDDLGQRTGTATIHITNQNTTENTFGQIMYDSDSSNQGIARIVFIDSGTASVDTAFVNEANNTKQETLRIKADGKVGIGTNSPNAKLEINSSITFSTIDTFGQLVVKAASGSTGDMLNIGVDTANSVAFIQAVERGVNTIPLSLQRYGGNVGIGTTNPDAKLEVITTRTGTPSSDTNIKVTDDTAQAADVGGSINFTGKYTDTGIYLSGSPFIRASKKNSTTGDYGYGLKFGVRATGSGTSNVAMTIDSDSNVGIGTASPSEILTIPGNYGVGLGYKTFYSSGGTVPAGIGPSYYLVATLNQLQGTTLSTYYQYKFFLTTTGTGTYNSSVYIVYPNSNNTAWLIREVARRGITSNHPELTISGNEARIYNDHPSAYGVLYRVESTNSNQANTAPDIFGSDYMWQRTEGRLTYIDGNVGIGTASPDRKLHVNSGTDNANTLFESTDTAVTVRFKDSTGEAELECRNDWRFSNNAGADERMHITSGGDIQIPTNSASLQLRSSGSSSYTSIKRDAANQLIVANTAGNQVFGIGNGGELAITNGASYTTTLTYTTGWNSSYQTLIPGNSLSPNAVYIVTIKCDSFGTPPYYASTVFHIATSPGTNGSGGGNDNIAPTATHVNSTVYWKYRLSTIVNGKNGVEAYLSGGPTPNGTTIYVKATKIMTM